MADWSRDGFCLSSSSSLLTSKDVEMGMPLYAQSILKAKRILLPLSGSSIWSKQKRAPERGDILYDMCSDRNCHDLWVTFAYVRQGMAEQEEGDCCQPQGAVWAGHALPTSSKLKNFLRQCRVALTSYWHWHNLISGHHSIYAVWSETNLSSWDISIVFPQLVELRFLNQHSD